METSTLPLSVAIEPQQLSPLINLSGMRIRLLPGQPARQSDSFSTARTDAPGTQALEHRRTLMYTCTCVHTHAYTTHCTHLQTCAQACTLMLMHCFLESGSGASLGDWRPSLGDQLQCQSFLHSFHRLLQSGSVDKSRPEGRGGACPQGGLVWQGTQRVRSKQ